MPTRLDFFPAAVIQRRSPLEDPLFEPGQADTLLPDGGLPPSGLVEPLKLLRARLRPA